MFTSRPAWMPLPFAPTFCDKVGSVFFSTMNAAKKLPRDMMAAVTESKPGFMIAQAAHAINATERTNFTKIRMWELSFGMYTGF